MAEQLEVKELDQVVVRFSGDSGDGMQLAGNIFSAVSATVGNDISTFPDYPADIRAPQGSLNGVSGFQVHIGAGKVYTPGDVADVLVCMNASALKTQLRYAKPGATPSARRIWRRHSSKTTTILPRWVSTPTTSSPAR